MDSTYIPTLNHASLCNMNGYFKSRLDYPHKPHQIIEQNRKSGKGGRKLTVTTKEEVDFVAWSGKIESKSENKCQRQYQKQTMVPYTSLLISYLFHENCSKDCSKGVDAQYRRFDLLQVSYAQLLRASWYMVDWE